MLRFTTATRIWPTNNISERGVRPLKPSRRSPAAWPATTSPRTAWTSGATSTQPASTARTPWTPRTTSCSAGPGDRQHKRSPSPPAWFGELDGLADEKFRERIMWLSFRDLAEAIGKLIADPGRSPASRPASSCLSWWRCTRRTGCSQPTTRSWSLPARRWPEYQWRGAYICQPNRSFRAGLK